jgi:hypothetical protein
MGHASSRAALIYQHRTTPPRQAHRRRGQQARPGRTQAIGYAAGTRQEEALMTASLMTSESMALAARFQVERMTGIEPALSAWKFNELVLIMQLDQ